MFFKNNIFKKNNVVPLLIIITKNARLANHFLPKNRLFYKQKANGQKNQHAFPL